MCGLDSGKTGRDQLLLAASSLIDLALAEDLRLEGETGQAALSDPSSSSTIDAEACTSARIVAKERGVIAGLPVAEEVFRRVDLRLEWTANVEEGQAVVPGERIAVVRGPTVSMLAAERVALNFLQRLSGIATQTRAFVDAVVETDARILDTRKTVPGFRILDKYAVRMGGGENHRMSLADMLLIKDNHIDAVGSLTDAVSRARTAHPELLLEVEIDSIARLDEALAIDPPVDRILLDNTSLEQTSEAVQRASGRVPLEASGNVSLETVATISATGVDYISVGALTHSVTALDLSMRVDDPADSEINATIARIDAARRHLGDRLVILGHHYVRDDVLKHADLRGDSLELARRAAETDTEFVVFCGVRFMAETGATLAKDDQRMFSASPHAGCALADTARIDAVRDAWDRIVRVLGEDEVIPIAYVNSASELKAFCGVRDGVVCTSANAAQIVRQAVLAGKRVLFLPDRHLGGNTARALGLSDEAMLIWHLDHSPHDDAIRRAQVILWPGACNVHQRFHSEQIAQCRADDPAVRIAVHPECNREVVSLADEVGSTSRIIRLVEDSPAGTHWSIGTEARLVRRLARMYPEQTIDLLADVPPYCAGMSEITLTDLARTLESIETAQPAQEVLLDEAVAQAARVTIERMLAWSA